MVHSPPNPSHTHTHTIHLAPEDDEWRITPAEFSHYFAYYHRISPRGEFLAGRNQRTLATVFVQVYTENQFLGDYMLAKLTMDVVRFDVPSFKGSHMRECQYLSGVHTTICLVSTVSITITMSLLTQVLVRESSSFNLGYLRRL